MGIYVGACDTAFSGWAGWFARQHRFAEALPRETSGLTHRQARCQDICQEAPAEEDEGGEGEDEEPEEEGEEDEKAEDRETSPGTSVGFTRFVGMICFEYHVFPPTFQGFLWASWALWRTWETFREQNIQRGGVRAGTTCWDQ